MRNRYLTHFCCSPVLATVFIADKQFGRLMLLLIPSLLASFLAKLENFYLLLELEYDGPIHS